MFILWMRLGNVEFTPYRHSCSQIRIFVLERQGHISSCGPSNHIKCFLSRGVVSCLIFWPARLTEIWLARPWGLISSTNGAFCVMFLSTHASSPNSECMTGLLGRSTSWRIVPDDEINLMFYRDRDRFFFLETPDLCSWKFAVTIEVYFCVVELVTSTYLIYCFPSGCGFWCQFSSVTGDWCLRKRWSASVLVSVLPGCALLWSPYSSPFCRCMLVGNSVVLLRVL